MENFRVQKGHFKQLSPGPYLIAIHVYSVIKGEHTSARLKALSAVNRSLYRERKTLTVYSEPVTASTVSHCNNCYGNLFTNITIMVKH